MSMELEFHRIYIFTRGTEIARGLILAAKIGPAELIFSLQVSSEIMLKEIQNKMLLYIIIGASLSEPHHRRFTVKSVNLACLIRHPL